MSLIHVPDRMKRIYVAGAYSADNVIKVLDNIREGMRLSTRIMLAGFAPFCPWLDFHFQLMLREGERFTVEDYYRYSLAWLDVSDALVVGDWPGCKESRGTQDEIYRASRIGIPIFYTPEAFFNGLNTKEATHD